MFKNVRLGFSLSLAAVLGFFAPSHAVTLEEAISESLKNSNEISKLLQLARNESHRFAINHHRKRRSKNFFSSSLDGIEGLGPKLKEKLIRHFGGIDKVLEASIDDLKSTPGIGEQKAQNIFSCLKN